MLKRIIDAESVMMDVMILEGTGNPLARKIILDQLRDLLDPDNPDATYQADQDLETILAEIMVRDSHAARVLQQMLRELNCQSTLVMECQPISSLYSGHK